MSFRFVFDPNRCTGCGACAVGCWMENRAEQGQAWRQVHTFNPRRLPGLPLFHLSLACHHCENPACLRNCPADAYTKDAATGAVTVNPERCIGCRYCTWACPHDAPKFNAACGTIEKCTFCPSRLERGLEPACVARCPVAALGFEAKGAGQALSADPPGFPASALRPSIRFVALRNPVPDSVPVESRWRRVLEDLLRVPESKVTLRGEWGLLLFTTVMAALSAWLLASLIGGPAVRPWAFLGAGTLVMGLSTLHLGRPERAWRAILHLKRSWLSREILLTGAFLGVSALHLIVFPDRRSLAWVAGSMGFVGLMAIDRLYRSALKSGLHSGGALLTGHYLMGLLANLSLLVYGAGAVKLLLYLHRKRHFAKRGRPVRVGFSLLRIALGFLGPLLLMGWNPGLAALSALLGDLVDRAEFYDELEVPTPARELSLTLRARVN